MKFKYLLTAFSLGAATSTAMAQAFPDPDRNVTITVPFPAGGPTDKIAREVAQLLAPALGTTVIVDNVAGAGGTIGAKKAAMAKPDGYTLLLHHIGMATSPGLYRNLSFSPIRDFEPIGSIADVPMLLIGSKSSSHTTLAQVLEAAKAQPKKLSLATAGLGSAAHLCGMMLMNAAQVQFTVVAYKGVSQALTDLIGGQTDLMCDQPTSVAGQVSSGAVQSYAAMQSQRIPAFSAIPSAAEVGFPQLSLYVWHGLYAPKGTPPATISRLSKALQAVVADPAFRSRLGGVGAEPVAIDKATPTFLRQLLATESARWAPLIKESGATAD